MHITNKLHLFTVFILCLMLVKPMWAQAPPTAATRKIEWNSDLQTREQIVLQGQKDNFMLDFPYPRKWKKAEGTVLVLRLAHSPALLPKFSHLLVELNGSLTKTIVLDESNIGPADISIPLEPTLLKEHNHLLITVIQHYTERCEDPFSTVLWTKLAGGSYFLFRHQTATESLNLQNWPYPILDLRQLGRQVITFLPSDCPSRETLQAAVTIAHALGALADYRQLDLTRQTGLQYPTVIVGTPKENPAIVSLASELPLPLVGDRFVDFDHKPIAQDAGVLQLIDSKAGEHPVTLLITGDTPKAVEKAATALVSNQFQPILGGRAALVCKVTRSLHAPTKGNVLGHMPPSSQFTLDELGYTTKTVHGSNPYPIEVEVNTDPGIKVVGHRQKMRVVFGYGAQVNTDLSSLEIVLNDVSLRSYALNRNDGEEHHVDLLEIPNNLVRSHNKLKFVFHLYPKRVGQCDLHIDHQLWGTLYDTTELDIDRENIIKLPDLALLKESGFPLTRTPELTDLAFVFSSSAKLPEIFQGLRLATLFGSWTRTPDFAPTVYHDNAVPDETKNSSHLLILAASPQNKLLQELNHVLTLTNANRLSKIFHTSEGDELSAAEIEQNGFLEEILSPWAGGKTILVCYGNSLSALTLAVDFLINPILRYELKGSLASLSPELIVKTVQSTPLTSFGAVAPIRLVAIWLSDNLWLAPLIIAILLLFLGLRLVKSRSKSSIKDELSPKP